MAIASEPGESSVVRLRAHGRLSPPVRGDVLVSVSVGPLGEAVALWASPADRAALVARHAARRASPQRPVSARVSVQSAGLSTVVTIAKLDMALCHVQPLPQGRIVVVARRGGTATIFDASGHVVQRGNLRDGIQHVRSTPSGQIWVGYFDEGVYGGDPVAHHGIVRFGEDLRPQWRYPFDTGFGPVHDCYTLNVAGETAWSCYYGDFPVVRIAGGAVTGWRNDVSGANAMMVDGDRGALVGGYERDDHARLVVGRLGDGRHERIAQHQIVMPDGTGLPAECQLLGVGPDLHVFVGDSWHRLGLDDLP